MSSRLTVCLVVPSGTWDVRPLIDAIRTHGDGASIVAVWAGDPHLRPAGVVGAGVPWCDLDLDEPCGAGWNRLLVAIEPRAYEWCRTAAAVGRLVDSAIDATASVLVLRVGSVAVTGPLASLTEGVSGPVALLPRVDGALPADGLAPGDADVVERGHHSTSVAAFSAGGGPALRWLGERLVDGRGETGPWLDRMAELFGAGAISASRAVTVGWPTTPHDGSTVSLLDLDHVDRTEPWHVDFGVTPARLRLSTEPLVAALVADGWKQCQGSPADPVLPGSVPVVGPVRTATSAALARWRAGQGDLPPEPYGERHADFTAWLEQSDPAAADIGRYWLAVRDGRADLQAAFPQPQAGDGAGLVEWAGASWRLENGTAILRSHESIPFGELRSVSSNHAIRSVGFDPAGINVVGYLDHDQSLGHIARHVVAALQAADVPVAAINHHRTPGSRRPKPFTRDRDARFATTIAVVNADQFAFLAADHGATLLDGRRTIAYWFWELEQVPAAMVEAIDLVDEIWTGSQFITDAFAMVTDKPVRRVPIPVVEPKPSSRDRASFGIPGDRFVFLTTFDYLSVPERKNPLGAIEAFTRAFAEDEGPLLWIKSMNGDQGWRNHERLLLAAAGRRDIVVTDEHLSRPDQMAVLDLADCLVSLHRSEGLGLHCAEAMWLSKPVIATRYSGNLDFMDDSCSALIEFDMTHVRHGEGVYPESALWADPDLDQAADWMRRIVADPLLAADLGRNAHTRMLMQPSASDTGRLMARLAGLQPVRG